MVTSVQSVNIFTVAQIKSLSTHTSKIYLICGTGFIKREVKDITEEIFQLPKLLRRSNIIFDFISLIQITIILNRLKPDLAIYSTPKSAFLGALASFLNRTPIRIYQVWGVRWQNLSGIKLWVVRSADFITIKLSTKITVVSKSVFEFIGAYYKTNKLVVLGSGSTAGVDMQIFYPDKPSVALRTKVKIGYAGRISNDKGITDLYNLFIKLTSQIPNLYLEIIGDLDLEDEISKELINDINSHSKIRWIQDTQQDKLAVHIRSWDAQIFLSRREGLGNVILEAGACGIPTFCWDIIGTRDAIPSFARNFLIPFADTNLLEKSVINYLDSPLSQSEKTRLSDWYAENFEQKKVLSKFTEFINDTLKVYHGSK
jgi:glycosyltransferase involved in cell wall biosynthesis